MDNKTRWRGTQHAVVRRVKTLCASAGSDLCSHAISSLLFGVVVVERDAPNL